MKVKGLTSMALHEVFMAVNDEHGTSLFMDNFKPVGRFWQFSVRLHSSKHRFHRRSHRGRRLVAACFHGHKALYEEIFKRNPEAVIVTAFARYDGHKDFLDKYRAVGNKNIGSQFQPLYMSEACDC